MPIKASAFREKLRGPLNQQIQELGARAESAAQFAMIRGERKFTVATHNASREACDSVAYDWKIEGWTVTFAVDERDGNYLEFSC